MKIEMADAYDESYVDAIDEGFDAFAEENGVVCDYTPFLFVAKEGEETMGFIRGYSYYKEVHVGELIVLERHRRKGIGAELIRTMEDHFKGKGFENINLSTFEFQAPRFYEKCGYTLEYVRKSASEPKLNQYFYVKYI